MLHASSVDMNITALTHMMVVLQASSFSDKSNRSLFLEKFLFFAGFSQRDMTQTTLSLYLMEGYLDKNFIGMHIILRQDTIWRCQSTQT